MHLCERILYLNNKCKKYNIYIFSFQEIIIKVSFINLIIKFERTQVMNVKKIVILLIVTIDSNVKSIRMNVTVSIRSF